MTERREFLTKATSVGAGLVLTSTGSVLCAAEATGYSDKLVDADGKYSAAALPFAYDALEPIIDSRTVEVHYNFHHKPAVAAANKAEELAATKASYRGAKATAADVTQAQVMLAQTQDQLLKARQTFRTALIGVSRWTVMPASDVTGEPPAPLSYVSTLRPEELREVSVV
jgi:hypothetical protein